MNHSKIRFLRDGSMLRWVDFGKYRFYFRRWEEWRGMRCAIFSISIVDESGERRSAQYAEDAGGWILVGFDMGTSHLDLPFISMCELDRLEIINSLA